VLGTLLTFSGVRFWSTEPLASKRQQVLGPLPAPNAALPAPPSLAPEPPPFQAQQAQQNVRPGAKNRETGQDLLRWEQGKTIGLPAKSSRAGAIRGTKKPGKLSGKPTPPRPTTALDPFPDQPASNLVKE
jgi:hypothetical protein